MITTYKHHIRIHHTHSIEVFGIYAHIPIYCGYFISVIYVTCHIFRMCYKLHIFRERIRGRRFLQIRNVQHVCLVSVSQRDTRQSWGHRRHPRERKMLRGEWKTPLRPPTTLETCGWKGNTSVTTETSTRLPSAQGGHDRNLSKAFLALVGIITWTPYMTWK